MYINSESLGQVLMFMFVFGAVISIVVLALGIWLAKKTYRHLRARNVRFAGLFATLGVMVLFAAVGYILARTL
ncbi:hypothetical protein FXN63_15315 [Pigmentiphaga aceris]|uniref:DUF2788 domain-containing protein n=1 Tax=Pigmentiphaga aceris TaxID=1940612 RepID=A0A5C0AY10_9BURK|nr:hypothetical protein [Pigmentiphaga aceris]QEI07055.1 hypothetical protein FXN63_15315 [Pigmentiphaga aceris]